MAVSANTANFVLVRLPNGDWRPATAEDAETARDFAKGKPIRVKAKRTRWRSVRRNAFFHALCAKVAEALGDPGWTTETVKMWLKLRLRLVDVYEVDGQPVAVPRSTAFGAMSEGEFSDFTSRSIDVVALELLPGVERDDLLREIELMIGWRLEETGVSA